MTRRSLASALASASLTVLVACDDSPPEPGAEPRRNADDDGTAASDPSLPGQDAPGQGATPPEGSRACASDVSMPLGNSYAALSCLPQLDEIGYWRSAREWSTYDDVPVSVAVLDLSFLADHPDIRGAVDMTWNFMQDGCTSFEQGKGDCTRVAPIVPRPPAPPAVGERQIMLIHGTMIAGVIAGRGAPGTGVVGVNPSARLELLVRDANTNNLSALRFAVERHVDVISMSWPLGAQAGDKDVPEFKELLETATGQGTVIVMAAGNSKLDVDRRAVYPTRYSTIPGVIAVGSIDLNGDFFAQFSNYGPSYVDLGAPGTAASAGGDFERGRYSVQIGTSYSGPMVAGAASRVIQYLKRHSTSYTAADVERLVVEGSRKSPNLVPYFREGRRLDMTSLLAHLKSAQLRAAALGGATP
ncbi:MAG: S8 family serine peptidase [Labilithrix sp.]|nr:S8 family serine peptidase [Labilithrix sp.]